jgi:hypothetical protein
MNPATLLIAVGFVGVIWYVVSTIRIYAFLSKRGINLNFLFLNVLILKYASQYKELTLKETGQIGPLYYHWIIPINIALVCAIILLVMKVT